MVDTIPLDQDEVLRLLVKAIDQRQPVDGIEIVRQWMDGAAKKIAELKAALAARDQEITKLRPADMAVATIRDALIAVATSDQLGQQIEREKVASAFVTLGLVAEKLAAEAVKGASDES